MMSKPMHRNTPASLVAILAIAATALCCAAAPAAAADSASPGETLARGSDCFSCHAIDQKVVGPSFQDIAGKFAGQADANATLAQAVVGGHVGTWGNVPMPPHPQLAGAKIDQIVSWMLSLKQQTSSAAPAAAPADNKQYTYTINGKPVSVSFPIFVAGTTKVTPEVFKGFETFNSYCFRCHGPDAIGGSYAPNLRASLKSGMTESQFLSVGMVGRKEKGMPAWAGFLSPEEIQHIYQYVKARSVEAVDTGTPPE